MNPIPGLRITLELGHRRRVLSGRQVCERLIGELVALVVRDEGDEFPGTHRPIHSQDTHGEPTEGSEGNVRKNEKDSSGSDLIVPSRQNESTHTSAVHTLDATIDWLASHLSHALNDAASLRFYRLIAARLPLEVLRSSLSLALELDAREVTRSRAAYFTAVIRKHLRPSRT